MRTNPLGSFVAADTPLSRIDARVKLLLLLVFTAGVFACQAAWAIIVWFALLALAMYAAHVEWRSLVRAVRPVTVILLFTLLANALVLDGHGDIAIAGPLGISSAGAIRGACAVLRGKILIVMRFQRRSNQAAHRRVVFYHENQGFIHSNSPH